MKKMIFPSCSEIVWKLDVPYSIKSKILKALKNEEDECPITYMAGDFPNNFLGIMISCLKREKNNGYNLEEIKLKMVGNDNGENWDFIKEGFELAKLCLSKKMGRREAKRLLEKTFDKNEE